MLSQWAQHDFETRMKTRGEILETARLAEMRRQDSYRKDLTKMMTDAGYVPVDNFPAYMIGKDGHLFSYRKKRHSVAAHWRRVKGSPGKYGHLIVKLINRELKQRRYAFIHSMVLEAFVGPKPDGFECRHFPDRDPSNNCLNNISWSSRLENAHDKAFHGTLPQGETCVNSKLTEREVRIVRELRSSGILLKDIASEFGVTITTIRRICSRELWRHVI